MTYLEQIKPIVVEAGVAIVKIFNGSRVRIKLKKDHSPVTQADILSNRILVAGIKEISDITIISEESGDARIPNFNVGKIWLIDPLDGTQEFISKNEEFTINIALLENGSPIFGLIYVPMENIFYWAEKGKGSYKNNVKIYNNSKKRKNIGATSRHYSTSEDAKFFEINNIKTIKIFGGALKFCKLAEGIVDIYPRFNGSKIWDTAAGQLIINEAGCKMTDVSTKKELAYNCRNLKNNYFVAYRKNLNFILP